MALKQLMIRKKLSQKREELKGFTEEATTLETRSAALEKAIEEAETDEEIKVVEDEVEALETEKEELNEKKGALENDIQELEGELETLDSKEPQNDPEPKPQERNRPVQVGYQERGGTHMPGEFRSMTYEERSALVKRSEVKDFLVQVRSLRDISQTRAVTGSELTIPEVMLGIIRDNLHKYSKLISKVNKKPLTGKGRQNIAGNLPEGIWMEAVGSLNELALLFKQVEIDEYKVGGFIPINNSTLEDSDLNLASEILEALSQAIGLAVDKAILYGSGKKMPLGIATRLAQTAKPSDWSNKAPEWKNLSVTNILKMSAASMTAMEFFAALILKLGVAKPNYSVGGTFWAMNRKTKMTLMSKALTFNSAGALVAGTMGKMPIEDGDIVVLDFVPDGDIIGGYGSVYLLGERSSIALAQSEHVRFLDDQTVFKGTARYDGAPVFGESFVMININDANPTTVVTFAPDQANEEDAYLSGLTIGSIELSPAFDSTVDTYTVATTDATNKITATKAKPNAVVSIDVGGTPVANGESATWVTGGNTVTITVSNGTTVKTYTVVVTKS